MDRPEKRIHLALFVGGSEDGLRMNLDMSDQEKALEHVNSHRRTNEGYEMHSWIITNQDNSREEFLLYSPEGWSSGDLLRRLVANYRGKHDVAA